MARYVSSLAEQGAKIIVESPPATARLLTSLKGAPQIIVKGDPIPDFDYYCSTMDLPRICHTTLETIPSTNPYLFAEASEEEFFHQLFKDTSKRRIGLCWAGRQTHENDAQRSLTFPHIADLLQLNHQWISLQRVVPDADAASLASSCLTDCNQYLKDFGSTAAAINALDLVITVDTAVAHLAGALGKPVWILLPFFSDWRWGMKRRDSPWYPSATLFRQSRRRDWADVIAHIKSALA